MTSRHKRVNADCIVCGSPFRPVAYQYAIGRAKCCSRSCAASLAAKNRDNSGPANNNWKGLCLTSVEIKQKYRLNNPEKYEAHKTLTNAVRRGELIPQKCEACGNPKSEGHHDDYSRPLDVRWLCKRHHLDHHVAARKSA